LRSVKFWKIIFCPKNRPLYSPNRPRGVSWPPWPTARSASGCYCICRCQW